MRAQQTRSAGLCLAACVFGWIISLAASEASAQTPDVYSQTSRRWEFITSADTLDAAATIHGHPAVEWYGQVLAAPVALSGQIVMPDGLEDWQAEGPSYFRWDDPTRTLALSPVGEFTPGDSWNFRIQEPPSRVAYAGALEMTRAISDPLLTADDQTRTVTVALDIPAGSLSGYDALRVELPDWYRTEGIAMEVIGSTYDTTAFSGSDGWFQAKVDPGVLAGTYTFGFDVKFTRSGELSQPQMGDLYCKPQVKVYCVRQTPWTQSTGTEVTHHLGGGMSATLETSETAHFTSRREYDVMELILDAVAVEPAAVAVGPAAPTEIWVGRGQSTSVSGLDVFGFFCGVEGSRFVRGTVTTPGNQTYEMELNLPQRNDEGISLDLEIESTDPAQVAEFTNGTYVVKVWSTDGSAQTYSVELTGEIPSDRPVFDQPAGFETAAPRPTLTWSEPTDPDVNFCEFEIEGDHYGLDDRDDEAWLDVSVDDMAYTPSGDLLEGGWRLYAEFAAAATGTVDAAEGTMQSVPFFTGHFRGIDSYINVVPEPVGLTLLAVGAFGLVGRARRKRNPRSRSRAGPSAFRVNR